MTPPICIDIPKQILFAMVTLPDLAPLLIMVILCARQFLCPFLCLRGRLKLKSAQLFAVQFASCGATTATPQTGSFPFSL